LDVAADGYVTSTVARPARVHWLLLSALVAGGYVAGYELAQNWFSAEDQGASFFPPAGVTLAALVLVTRRQWPIVLGAAALAELVLDLESGLDLAPTLGLVLANTAEPLVGALLLTTFFPVVDLRRTRDLTGFLVFAVVAAPVVGAAIAATTFVTMLDGSDGARFALEWWSGDGLGVLVVGSAILALRPPPRLSRRRSTEAAALALAAILTTATVFLYGWFVLVYVPIALLVVIAFRVGTVGVAITSAAVAFIAAGAAAEARGFWDVLDVTPANRVLYLQLGIAVVISAVLALAAEIWQRERMAGELARTESEKSAALERAALYEAERAARERAELLERHAARIAASASVQAIAAATLDELEKTGVEIAVMGIVRGGVVETIGTSGIPEATRQRYSSFSLSDASVLTDAIRTGEAVIVESGAEYERRYPSFAHVRRETGMSSIVGVPLRGARRNEILGALTVSARAADGLGHSRRQLVAAVADQAALALERALLQIEADRAAADAALLARLGEVLERATTTAGRASELVHALSDELGAAASVHVPDSSGELVVVASAGGGEPSRDDEIDVPRLAADALAVGGAPAIVESGDSRAQAIVLRARARALGVLALVVPTDDVRVNAILLQRIATRAALALDNALLYEQERNVSHSLQLSLLGGQPAPGRGTDVASAYLPATQALEVGGDWYDVLDLPRGTRAFVVGDVVGHGLEAAKAMGQLRGAVRALAPIGTPTDLLTNLDVFVESVPEASMSTLAYVELDPETGRIRYACAGHPPPLVVSPDGGARLLWDGRSTPLGSSLGSIRVEAEERVAHDETVILYTDGLVERRDVGLDAMLERLVDAATAAAGSSPARLVDGILSMLTADSLEDDVCMLAVRFVAADHFTRTLPAAPNDVAALRRELDGWLSHLAVPAIARRDLVLAVAEAAANAAEHAYGFDGAGVIRVDVRREEDGALSASVADEGTWREPVEDLERGRGIRIIRALVDDVSIASDARGTVVHMRLPVEVVPV
jgi:serine/threonine-protein kinase RsbW